MRHQGQRGNADPQAPGVLDAGLSFGQRPMTRACCNPTGSPPGIRSRTTSRTRTASGTATIAARSASAPASTFSLVHRPAARRCNPRIPQLFRSTGRGAHRQLGNDGGPCGGHGQLRGHGRRHAVRRHPLLHGAEGGRQFRSRQRQRADHSPGHHAILFRLDGNLRAMRDTLDGNPPRRSCHRGPLSRASLTGRSRPMPCIRMPPGCGWSTSVRTMAAAVACRLLPSDPLRQQGGPRR